MPTNNPDRKDNETDVFRAAESIGKDLFDIGNKMTLPELFQDRFKDSNRIGFSHRIYDPSTETMTNKECHYTNGEFYEQVKAIGSAIMSNNWAPETNEYQDYKIRFVGMYCPNNLQQAVVDVASSFYGLTLAPIYDTLGEEATAFAFKQTKMAFCCIAAKHLPKMAKLNQEDESFSNLRTLLVLDPENMTAEFANQTKIGSMTIVKWGDALEMGRKNNVSFPIVTAQTIYAFSYTSGTTGEPKGAMLSHYNMVAVIQNANAVMNIQDDDCHLSYLPMAHIFERAMFNCCIAGNIRICFFSGNILKLKEDLAVFRPTLFASVPRLYNKFYDAIWAGVKEKGSVAQFLFKRGLKVKQENLKKEAEFKDGFYDSVVFKKARMALGGRVRLMITASAPISQEVLDFIKVVFAAPVLEAYGQTEGGGLEFITNEVDPFAGHVGGPAPILEFKLVDIPEMNYTNKDVDAKGHPSPRGEIWVRGPGRIPGYYLNDEKNKETFTEDGWLKSGDVGILEGPKRRMRIIDRKKNIFKLAQGEYIAPEKLENGYKVAHSSIATVFVHGDSLQTFLVGVLNVEKPALLAFAKENGIEGEDPVALAKNKDLRKKYIKLLDQVAVSKKFNSLEKIRNIYIETEPFQALKLLTEGMKMKRLDTRNHFKLVLDELYAEGSI